MMKVGVRDYLKAGFPGLFLPSTETEVAVERVRAALVELNLGGITFGVWKVTTGFLVSAGCDPDAPKRKEGGDELLDVLAHIAKATVPICAIFHNVRGYLTQTAVIQGIIDAILAARLVGSHLIFVGAFCELPQELRGLITFVDCPLPTRDEIEQRYRVLVDAYKKDMDDIPKDKASYDKMLIAAANAAIGLDSMGVENALALSMASTNKIDLAVIQGQKEQAVRQSDILEFIYVDDELETGVGGFDRYKSWIAKRQRAFTDEARAYYLPFPKGVLFVGPAGTGKSLAAKVTARYLRLPCLRLDMGRIFRSLQGESEAAIRFGLQVAEAVSPVSLWIDEMDKGMAGMRGSGELDSGTTARVIQTILTWRQETRYPVFLCATANDVATLPSMVYRKGRLDEVWATDLPTYTERAQVVGIHLLKRHRDPKKFQVELIAKSTERFVPAEIEGVIEDAMYSAFDAGEEVNTKHILTSISDTVPQAERDKEEIQAIRDWVASRARPVSSGEPVTVNVNGTKKVRQLNLTKPTKRGD